MLESLSIKEENIIKGIKNLFRVKKELNCNAIKVIGNLFRHKKKLKQLMVEYLEVLRIFLSIKKKKIITNQ